MKSGGFGFDDIGKRGNQIVAECLVVADRVGVFQELKRSS
jgi:hypothetical protein